MVHSLTQIVTQHALERTRCRLSGERPLSGGCLFLGASARALSRAERDYSVASLGHWESRCAGRGSATNYFSAARFQGLAGPLTLW